MSKIYLTKEEIQIIIQIIENTTANVKQTEEILLPLLTKLRQMLIEENGDET